MVFKGYTFWQCDMKDPVLLWPDDKNSNITRKSEWPKALLCSWIKWLASSYGWLIQKQYIAYRSAMLWSMKGVFMLIRDAIVEIITFHMHFICDFLPYCFLWFNFENYNSNFTIWNITCRHENWKETSICVVIFEILQLFCIPKS